MTKGQHEDSSCQCSVWLYLACTSVNILVETLCYGFASHYTGAIWIKGAWDPSVLFLACEISKKKKKVTENKAVTVKCHNSRVISVSLEFGARCLCWLLSGVMVMNPAVLAQTFPWGQCTQRGHQYIFLKLPAGSQGWNKQTKMLYGPVAILNDGRSEIANTQARRVVNC